MTGRGARVRRWLGVSVLGVALVAAQALGAGPARAAVPPVLQGSSSMATADALPTVQIDGVVWAQVVVGTTVYAGGDFVKARSPEGDPKPYELTRKNLIAYDLLTGRLKGGFKPATVNGVVRTVARSSDGKTVYIGGDFTKVGSATRLRFAALDARTGKLRSAPAPAFNTRVNALAVKGGTVYAGGWFTVVGVTKRARLAAFSASTGKLGAWAPSADGAVNALVVTPNGTRVIAGGGFSTLNKTTAPGMGALDATSGVTRTWKINKVVKNNTVAKTTKANASAAIYSLAVDADTVYGTGYAYYQGNFEGTFAASPTDGTIRWLQDCHGDTYGVAPVGGLVYSVGHAHMCSNIGGFPEQKPRQHYRALVMSKAAKGTVATNTQTGASYGDFAGQKAPALYNWFPDLSAGRFTGQTQAAWSIVAGSGYLALAGEFTAVNGRPQQGVVRFTTPNRVTPAQGPLLSGAGTTPVVDTSGALGGALVRWTTNRDRDDLTLDYVVQRDGVEVYRAKAVPSPWWKPTTQSWRDLTALPGATYRYTVTAVDRRNVAVVSPAVTVTLPLDPSGG